MTSPAKTEPTAAAKTNPKTANDAKQEPKPKNPDQLKKAVALGKEMVKEMATNPELTKADIARKMYELIHGEPREIIAQAFVDGANLTPKGAMTYYYNCKRKGVPTAKTASKDA
jgi:hypothetical protein